MLLRLPGQGNQEFIAISATSTGYGKLHFETESTQTIQLSRLKLVFDTLLDIRMLIDRAGNHRWCRLGRPWDWRRGRLPLSIPGDFFIGFLRETIGYYSCEPSNPRRD